MLVGEGEWRGTYRHIQRAEAGADDHKAARFEHSTTAHTLNPKT